MRSPFLAVLAVALIFLCACLQPITVTDVTEPEEEETTVSELAELELDMQYNGDTYLATFETISPEEVEPTGRTVDGKQVYVRPGVSEEDQIFIPNDEGVLELWVNEDSEIPVPDCPDDSWPVNGVCRVGGEDSEVFAEIVIEDSPTYGSAGLTYTLELVGNRPLACDYCWEFEYEFACYYPGYGFLGDTPSEQYGAYPHRAVVRVEQGEVTSLIYDGVWDELNQRMIG